MTTTFPSFGLAQRTHVRAEVHLVRPDRLEDPQTLAVLTEAYSQGAQIFVLDKVGDTPMTLGQFLGSH